jgi:hypothetical protein
MTADEWQASTDSARMLRFVHENPDHENITCCRSDRKLRLFACACGRELAKNHLNFSGMSRTEASHYIAAFEDLADGVPLPHDVPSSAGCYLAGTPQSAAGHCANLQHPAFAALLRDICGDPFRPVLLPLLRRCWKCHREAPVRDRQATLCRCGTWSDLEPFCPWLTPTVLALASAPYDLRTPDGTLDPVRLLVLADALEEVGCLDERCQQCHGRGTYTVHVRNDAVSAMNGYGPATTYSEWRGCRHCGGGHDRKGTGRIPHPLLAHLRSPGPHVRGCAVLDAILGRE